MPDSRRIVTYLFVGAMVAAPFLALLYDVNAGLAVLAGALAVTSYLAFDAAKVAEPALRQRLLLLASLNAVLTVLAAGFVVFRLIG